VASSFLTLIMFLVFLMCGMLLGSLSPKRKSHTLALTSAFIVIILLMGDLPVLIIFFVGLTVSSMMSARMKVLKSRKVKQETIRI
jgi:quinol-cytochrome oxidoreductase complex cytochrome b subunit